MRNFSDEKSINVDKYKNTFKQEKYEKQKMLLNK